MIKNDVTNMKTLSRSKIIEKATLFFNNLYSARDTASEIETTNRNSATLGRFSTREVIKEIES